VDIPQDKTVEAAFDLCLSNASGKIVK
jgi:hypothetical protein